jgi:hypothetical protein
MSSRGLAQVIEADVQAVSPGMRLMRSSAAMSLVP